MRPNHLLWVPMVVPFYDSNGNTIHINMSQLCVSGHSFLCSVCWAILCFLPQVQTCILQVSAQSLPIASKAIANGGRFKGLSPEAEILHTATQCWTVKCMCDTKGYISN